MKYQVTVRADYPWTTARVGGILFHKTDAVQLTDEQLTDEIRASDLLTIAPLKPPAPAEEPLSVDSLTETVDEEKPKTTLPAHARTTRTAQGGKRGGRP